MRRLIKNVLYSSLDGIGYNWLKRRQHRNSILILTYHSVIPRSERFTQFDYRNCVSTQIFEKQIQYLKRKYRLISMQQAVALLKSGEIDHTCAVITFDDGFENNYRYAYPILKKYDAPAVFYVTTNYIGKKRLLWTEKVTAGLLSTNKSHLSLKLNRNYSFALYSLKDRERASVLIRQYLKFQPRSEVDRVLKDMAGILPSEEALINHDPERYAFMTWQQLQEMAENGMEIGSHTKEHNPLNLLTTEEVRAELSQSKDDLAAHLNNEQVSFSYPNGDEGNFTPQHFELLAKLNYSSACTQLKGFNTGDTPLFALHRINISSQMTLPVFKAYVSGNYNFFA